MISSAVSRAPGLLRLQEPLCHSGINRTAEAAPSPSSTLQIPQLCFPAVFSSCY